MRYSPVTTVFQNLFTNLLCASIIILHFRNWVALLELDFHAGIVKILKPDGELAGTGFLVSDNGLIATCSHVILAEALQKNGREPPDKASIVFYAGGEQCAAQVLKEYWRPLPEDVAFLKVEGGLPERVRWLPLGPAPKGKIEFQCFGFPALHPEGLDGEGKIIGRANASKLRIEAGRKAL